mgnify:FL=1
MVYKSVGWLGARLTYHGSNTEVSQDKQDIVLSRGVIVQC